MRNTKRTFIMYASSLILAAGLVGCASHGDERTTTRKWDDKATAHRVRKNLADAPMYKFGEVDVVTYNGQVQLSGFVETDDQRRMAEQIARNTRGVSDVVNNIGIKPGTPVPTGRAYDESPAFRPQNPPPPPPNQPQQ